MEKKTDCGWEFPLSGESYIWKTIGNGMSLRDWFAGMALQGLCTWSPDPKTPDLDLETQLAVTAWAIADRMLKVRAEG